LEEEIKALRGGTANEGEKQDPAIAHQQQMNLFNPVLHCSELKRKIQEMMSDYIALEEYFMVQSVKKACDNPIYLRCTLIVKKQRTGCGYG